MRLSCGKNDKANMESPLEKVTCDGPLPVTGMAKALKIPVWLLENKMDFSSNEKELPPMEIVFMNCSIEYFLNSRQSPEPMFNKIVNRETAEHIIILNFIISSW